jgi:hypothetical protein
LNNFHSRPSSSAKFPNQNVCIFHFPLFMFYAPSSLTR